MTAKKRALVSLVVSALLVLAARALLEVHDAYAVWILFPGIMADLLISGNVHGGSGGITGEAVTMFASVVVWFLIVFLAIAAFQTLKHAFRRKNEEA